MNNNFDDIMSFKNKMDNISDFSEYIAYNGLQQELCKYENYLFDFFRNKSDEIESIYSAIRNNDFPYNKISHFIDIAEVSEKYISYFVGFTDYACKLAELINSEDDIDYDDVIDVNIVASRNQKISNADNIFLKSLFNTTDNEVVDINTAMKNIEYALSSDNYIRKEIEDRADCVYYKLKNINDNKFKNVAMQGLEIYYKSIREFYINYVSVVQNTYISIINSIKTRTPAIEKEVKKYQLF